MKLYIYNQDTMKVVAIAEGETNQECEDKASAYSNDYGMTYTPAFGFADGLVESGETEIEYL